MSELNYDPEYDSIKSMPVGIVKRLKGTKAKKLLNHLWNKSKDKKCFFCKIKMVRCKSNETNHDNDNATIEHIYPRTDIRRFIIKNNEHVVLCCQGCNQKRNDLYEVVDWPEYRTKQIDLIELLKNKHT